MTSPPYWFGRDNGHPRQIGLEFWPGDYIADLVSVFSEVRRVLNRRGTLWINIGDCFCTRKMVKPSRRRADEGRRWADASALGLTMLPSRLAPYGIKEGDLLLSWELAAALRTEGWYFRSHVTRVKTRATPDPADRPRRISEPVLMLTTSQRGYHYTPQPGCETDVWTLPPAKGHAQHSSMMPLELARHCLLIGSPPGGRVLDPFGGLGTTCGAAKAAGRSARCIEINPAYAKEARRLMAEPD
ncbi:DNA-methyltransferase [Dankookia rubra]|uniref:DNA-methyltransferase n=1 Tax=Dankookia rubra TaxID=1442381 RepID=UPI0014073B00|nr:site-specific DNA-methyltransferase [Dankookia rubra]